MKAKPIILAILISVIAAVLLFVNGLIHSNGYSPVYAQIKVLSAVIESYRNDYGHYPTDPATTEQLRANATFDSTAYAPASAFLYRALTGSSPKNSAPSTSSTTKHYFGESGIPPKWLKTTETGETYFVDIWGNSLGYSTFKAVHPESPDGYNPSFDLWSTGGDKKQVEQARWFKNW